MDYLELTPDEVWALPRFEQKLPKPRKGYRWRKKIKEGWLIGTYYRDDRKSPIRIEWSVADTSGQIQRILDKSW